MAIKKLCKVDNYNTTELTRVFIKYLTKNKNPIY